MQTFFELAIPIQLLIGYLGLINLVTFFYFGFDKLKAQWATRRVSEKMLWTLSLIGGSVGGLLGMYFFRHKTKKVSFQSGMIIIIALQMGLITLIFFYE